VHECSRSKLVKWRLGVDARKPADGPAAAGRSSLPWWLLGLGVAALGTAFSHRDVGAAADALVADLQFDLSSLEAPGAGISAGVGPGPAGLPYSASRRSNRAFALVHVGEGRFYALYGPPPARAGEAPPMAGVLVGDGAEADGLFSSDNLHEFSIESGPLRISAQSGRHAPARFIEGDTLHADSADTTVPPDAGDATIGEPAAYQGRLADLAGTSEASLSLGRSGELALTSRNGCSAQGQVRPRAAAMVWDVEARFGAGCAHDGETLHGHALLRQGELYLVLPSDELDGGILFSGRAASMHALAPARR